MADVNEITILQEGFVKITNLKIMIGTKSYPMSDITSVNVMKRGKSKVPFLWVIGGLLLTLWVVIDETRQFAEFFNIGILLMISGIVLFIIAKPTYTVHVGSALGESNILRSTNLTFIQRVVEALNNALALRK